MSIIGALYSALYLGQNEPPGWPLAIRFDNPRFEKLAA